VRSVTPWRLPGPGFVPGVLPARWWEITDAAEAQELESELERETPVGHPLRDTEVHAVACRRHRKDVVFWLPVLQSWALVHLTWTVETEPHWPRVSLHDSWSEVAEELLDMEGV